MSMLARKVAGLVLLMALTSISGVVLAQDNPSLKVSDQPMVNGMITVAQVVAAQDGWVAIHTFAPDGKPVLAPLAGLTAVKAGTTSNVQVRLNKVYQPGTKLLAMLHIDAGTRGTYEFPNGPDVPVSVGGNTVMMEFTIQAATSTATPASNTGQAAGGLPNTGASSNTVPLLAGLALLAVLVGLGLNRSGQRRTRMR
jgi:LPXTG-motif cell wall-anchored protein